MQVCKHIFFIIPIYIIYIWQQKRGILSRHFLWLKLFRSEIFLDPIRGLIFDDQMGCKGSKGEVETPTKDSKAEVQTETWMCLVGDFLWILSMVVSGSPKRW